MGYRPGRAGLSAGQADGDQGDDGLTLQNRVQPDGEIIAHPARGTFTGNRGILHRSDRTLGTARWQHKAWICCLLQFKDHHRIPMTGRNWTELFFHDEAVALAAGHRPCGYCRRADYRAFRAAWEAGIGPVNGAPAMDKALHAARVDPRSRMQRRIPAAAKTLPDGAFFHHDGGPWLAHDGQAWPFSPQGYGPPAALPEGIVPVMTPSPMLACLAAGYRPVIRLSE